MQEPSSTEHCRTETVFGVPVTCCSMDYALSEIDRNIRSDRERRYVSLTNTEAMYHAKRIHSHLKYIQNAAFSFCDGIGVVIAARCEGKKVCRINGPVLMLKCCDYGVERKWRHYFCGGKPGVADLLSKKLTEKFPGMITAGTYSPPFRTMTEDEDREMVDQINATKPDILWVGLGLLKQERWIAEHIKKIKVPLMIPDGAAFEYHAGVTRWAPKPIRRIGLEWLWRFCFEPRRLFIRNIRSFIWLSQAVVHSLSKKRKRAST